MISFTYELTLVKALKFLMGSKETIAPEQEPIPLSKNKFGHAFSTHGEDMTDFLINKANGSGQAQGQFLDNQAAARYIMENLDKLNNGSTTLPLLSNVPARIINADGTFIQATRIRIVPSGSGVKTAYPML